MTLAEFRIAYPEFSQASDALVQVYLDAADTGTSDTFKDRDTIIGLRTAHSLALSPHGRAQRLDPKKGETPYAILLEEMINTNGAARFRVF